MARVRKCNHRQGPTSAIDRSLSTVFAPSIEVDRRIGRGAGVIAKRDQRDFAVSPMAIRAAA